MKYELEINFFKKEVFELLSEDSEDESLPDITYYIELYFREVNVVKNFCFIPRKINWIDIDGLYLENRLYNNDLLILYTIKDRKYSHEIYNYSSSILDINKKINLCFKYFSDKHPNDEVSLWVGASIV
uniref:GIY endonuclease n=1 Tax=Clonostachys rogersoniana TaxID=122658 RepID=A0A8F1Y2K4_CLORO|nr:GIY endonuclease [Clonostachys rogersoniana]